MIQREGWAGFPASNSLCILDCHWCLFQPFVALISPLLCELHWVITCSTDPLPQAHDCDPVPSGPGIPLLQLPKQKVFHSQQHPPCTLSFPYPLGYQLHTHGSPRPVLSGSPGLRPLHLEREDSRVDRHMDTKDRLPGDKVKACFFHCATLGMFFPCLALTCQVGHSADAPFRWGMEEILLHQSRNEEKIPGQNHQ